MKFSLKLKRRIYFQLNVSQGNSLFISQYLVFLVQIELAAAAVHVDEEVREMLANVICARMGCPRKLDRWRITCNTVVLAFDSYD